MLSLRSKLLLVGTVLAATLIVGAASADAQCYWYRPVAWTCYTPCYTACYTPCYYGTYSTWYLGWRPGPIRRLILGPYRWYWAGYGGVWYGDCCWTTTAWYDCCVSDVSVPAVQQPAAQPTPAEKPLPQPTPEPAEKLDKQSQPTPTPAQEKPGTSLPPPAGGVTPPAGGLTPPGATTPPLPGIDPLRMPGPSGAFAPTPADSGLLTVVVPFEAKVFINGMETKSTGSRRQFVSYGLKPGYSYRYDIRVELVRDGKLEVATMTKVLKAGSREFATFPFQKPDEEFAAVP